MMMKFTKLTNDIQDALYDFCVEQEQMNGYSSEEEIDVLVESAFAVLDRIPNTSLPVTSINRYHIFAGEQYTDEIFPEKIKNNGVLYAECIHLGSFMTDTYTADDNEAATIARGYDVVYDIKSSEIKLLYRIMTTDDNLTTFYRVNTDVYEDFDVYEFIIDISSQIVGKLKQSISVPTSISIKVMEV